MTEAMLSAFLLLFVVIDPIGVASLYCALSRGYSAEETRAIAVRGTLVAFWIIVAFVVGGGALLRVLGITMPAFTVAGGILLFLLAVDMVLVRQSGLRTATPSEQHEAEQRTDISVFPLAIPMIAGPGTLTTVLLLTGQAGWGDRNWWQATAGVVAVVALVLLITLAMLLSARRIQRLLGETGVNVIVRLFGILLAALAVQYVSNGIHQLALGSAPS